MRKPKEKYYGNTASESSERDWNSAKGLLFAAVRYLNNCAVQVPEACNRVVWVDKMF